MPSKSMYVILYITVIIYPITADVSSTMGDRGPNFPSAGRFMVAQSLRMVRWRSDGKGNRLNDLTVRNRETLW